MFQGVQVAICRTLLKGPGQWSDGIKLCTTEGLTSGMMLDYVYENKARGKHFLGRWIDKSFIRHKGWEGTRVRRKNLEALLSKAIDACLANNEQVHLLDIASGPARYIHNVISRYVDKPVSAHCQDIDSRWLDAARIRAERAGLDMTFKTGDAFDFEALAALGPSPDIIVASGFYDWIMDDAQVLASMRATYEQLRPGGYFIVTNQVSHPNLDFVQALFSDFTQSPLRMRMRSTDLLTGWLSALGFEVEETKLDKYGYYSVMKAKKP